MRMNFFFNDAATTEIYTLSLHDALPISRLLVYLEHAVQDGRMVESAQRRVVSRRFEFVELGAGEQAREAGWAPYLDRSEEHTSELQSRQYLVCRLLLEKKKY